ncbi:unnamed protein product [Peronospora belbahrii]|uniref:Secreted protein n=1 Tax=Peronospora belbahrii TaxID=622444 RepID=A0AAU9L0G2_9STRA|nr:unnamed protein product [Peronospora belbahrii]
MSTRLSQRSNRLLRRRLFVVVDAFVLLSVLQLEDVQRVSALQMAVLAPSAVAQFAVHTKWLQILRPAVEVTKLDSAQLQAIVLHVVVLQMVVLVQAANVQFACHRKLLLP